VDRLDQIVDLRVALEIGEQFAVVAIMRRYRDRGAITSETWEMERFDGALVREAAQARLG
jgi:hypothetical protein